jgi:hypothetical protein
MRQRVDVVCAQCGKACRKSTYDLAHYSNSFCSRDCKNTYYRGRTRSDCETPTARFWKSVNKDGYCWLWTRKPDAYGYGVFSVNGRHTRAHRFSWELHHGPVPDGLWVLHKCDTPACVRPDHLFIGTQMDNVTDMIAKGRYRGIAPKNIREDRACQWCGKRYRFRRESQRFCSRSCRARHTNHAKHASPEFGSQSRRGASCTNSASHQPR